MIWTSLTPVEKQAAVRELVEMKSATYSEAALQLGTSRVAIAGVVERTRRGGAEPIVSTSGKKSGRRATGEKKKKRAKPKHAGLTRYVPIEKSLPPPDAQLFESAAWVPLPHAHPIAVTQHREGQCRFPHGDGPFSYCGEPVRAGAVYCKAHCAIAYRGAPT